MAALFAGLLVAFAMDAIVWLCSCEAQRKF